MENNRKPIDPNIVHYAQLRNGDYLGHWDLDPGKDYKVTIASLSTEEVYNQTKNKKEVVTTAEFKSGKKRMILNATNRKNIASLHGDNPHKWIGKEITIYRTETRVMGKTEECIRVRGKSKSSQAQEAAE